MNVDVNFAYSSFLKAIEYLTSVGNLVEYKKNKPNEFSSLVFSVASFYICIQKNAARNSEIYQNAHQIIVNTLSKYPELEGLKNKLLIDTL